VIGPVVLDSGPLVAAFSFGDRHHPWVIEQIAKIRPPLLTCEAVISEALFLLRRDGQGANEVMSSIRRGAISIAFSLAEECENVASLLDRYSDLPMSFADACLVRLAEQTRGSRVMTFDRHFEIYRFHRHQPIPTLMPPA
jgi:predicted nucleic acid-binding protein